MMQFPLLLAFLFLTQSEAPKYGVTRASVNPERFDASIETAVYRELPARHLVRTWHDMGSRVLLLVPADRESTAEHFRRQCGFVAWQGGADGVLVPKTLSASRTRALGAAKTDVATCERLKELAEKCLAKPEPVRTAGRRELSHLHLMFATTDDLDCLRLENVVRAERLAKLLGEPCGLKREVAAALGDEPAEPLFDATKFTELKLGFGEKSVELPGGAFPLKVASAPFAVRLSGKGDKPLAKPPFPGGWWRLRLWIMTADGFLPYRYELDLRRPDEIPEPIYRPAAVYCNLERRFGPVYGEEPFCARVKDRPVRTPSPDYPDLRASVSAGGVGECGWLVTFSLALDGLAGRWPATTPGREDVWYLEVVDPGERTVRVKLVWPVPADASAAEANRARFEQLVDVKRIETEFKERVLGESKNRQRWPSLVERWTASAKETGFGFSSDECESDRAFYEGCLKPLIEAQAKSGERTTAAAFIRRVEQARKEFLLK